MIYWIEEYSCFDLDIDAQHKKLIELLNSMEEIVELQDGYDHYDEIVSVFNELKNYTVYHFSYEEKLFEKHNYDPINTKLHKLEHKSFINKVSEINFDDIDRDQIKSVKNILEFVEKWIDQHILSTDIKFGDYLSKNSKSLIP